MPATAVTDRDQARAERKLSKTLRRLPRYCSVIDEVVLSDTGIFVVVPTAVAGDVTICGADVRCDTRSLEPVVEHAKGLAQWVGSVLKVDVRPMVVPIGGRLQLNPLFPSPIVRGVRFCAEQDVVHLLTEGPEAIARDEIEAVASRVRSLAS